MKKFNPENKSAGLVDISPQYDRINDCLLGGDAIKKKGIVYLPKPDPTNTTEENSKRYDQYLERALFYGITSSTVSGMVGLVYSKPQPQFELPESLIYLSNNIDGSGITLEQQTKKVLHNVSSLGRAGLLTDYSKSDGKTSQQDVVDGKVRAVIRRYDATSILWTEYKSIGVNNVLSLVVLAEQYKEPSGDGYTTESKAQFRVLRLIDNSYVQEIYRHDEKLKEYVLIDSEGSIPKDNLGNLFDHIPFTFVGSTNNDSEFDVPPMLFVSDLNIAHYRNSADYEESCFVNGQPTYYFSGLTKTWIDQVLKGVVRIGSRGGVPLPEGSSAGILQSSPNTLPAEGMKTKELQAQAIGAQLSISNTVTTTATEVNRESVIEDSILSSIVSNVEQAYNFCFDQVTLFTGIIIPKYEINKEFSFETFDANKYTSLLNGAMQGQNTKEDGFNYLKKTGMVKYDIEFDEWDGKIINQIPSAI